MYVYMYVCVCVYDASAVGARRKHLFQTADTQELSPRRGILLLPRVRGRLCSCVRACVSWGVSWWRQQTRPCRGLAVKPAVLWAGCAPALSRRGRRLWPGGRAATCARCPRCALRTQSEVIRATLLWASPCLWASPRCALRAQPQQNDVRQPQGQGDGVADGSMPPMRLVPWALAMLCARSPR